MAFLIGLILGISTLIGLILRISINVYLYFINKRNK